ncbi:iron complex outermembrane recepter protein [Fontimonas thermophila]|uniref:Iron complex outermembrane recepter protein n=1 Tax=Fontimonas thermophila TaxID=1076937 RepID=A0A1I2HQS3_9GAMM|nr:hypothetical protein [Fontimonas thermophila]SFF31753.1 iron complex outermembrane recepter protein [Fontimonas thermophila]
MNRLLMSAAVALLASCASTPRPPNAAQAIPETSTPVLTRAADRPSNCLLETGSRIPRTATDPCVAAPGQVYTREDLDRTGATTTAEALRKLSPLIR